MATKKKMQGGGTATPLKGAWIDKQKAVLAQANKAKCGKKVSKKK